jgi:mRNA interferase YafQ
MYTPVYTNQFAKDVKKAQKRGKNLDKFKVIAETLLSGQPLDEVYRDHKLVGNLSSFFGINFSFNSAKTKSNS